MRRFSIALAVSGLLLVSAPFDFTEGSRTTAHADYFAAANSSLFTLHSSLSASLLFTGDILLDRGVRKVIEKKGADALFTREIDDLLTSGDVVVGNLECPATLMQAPVYKKFIFRAEPEYLETLKKHGFTHLNLCNNHSIDQGREGLLDTRRNILKAGMIPVGAGQNMEEAAKAVLLTSSPRKVWLLTSLRMALENMPYLPDRPCVSQEPVDSLIARIRVLKENDPRAVVIVSLHWGGEHTTKPIPAQRMEAHCLIDAGADALICHHTHTLQTIEHYRGKPIYYSIGNFIFDLSRPINSRACMVRLVVTRQSVEAQTIPIVLKRCVPQLVPTDHANP